MQSDREEESTSLLLSQGPALLWPARGSLAHPDTNCTSGNRLTDLSASHWSAMTMILKNLLKGPQQQQQDALCQEAKMQTTSPTKSWLNTVTRETIRDALGLVGCSEADYGL